MKAKLIIEGKEHDIELSEGMLSKFGIKIDNKTGYERVSFGSKYYFIDTDNQPSEIMEDDDYVSRIHYSTVNYYSDEIVAENNARADMLMRQLRRFAAQHNSLRFDWREPEEIKYCIYYNNQTGEFEVAEHHIRKGFGQIYFDSQEIAYDAINTFKNELLWYFTDYRDRL